MSRKTERERIILGMDLGGTKTVVVLARSGGEILAESRLEDWTTGSWERDLEQLEAHARVLLRGAGTAVEELHAIGLSVPGALDPVDGTVIDSPNLDAWTRVPIVKRLFDAFGVQVLLENDANAAALAEWRFGAGQGTRSLVYATTSTGFGAGMVLEGRIYRGGSFQAGEVGHMPVELDGRLCHCGLRGCLEAYVGGAALADRMREDAAAGRADAILALADGEPARISARLWVEALRAGDAYAKSLREEFLDRLSQGLAILIHTLDPDAVVLGTIVRENPDLFMEDLKERTYARVWETLRHVRIVPGALGAQLPAYAALSVASLEPSDLSPPDASRGP